MLSRWCSTRVLTLLAEHKAASKQTGRTPTPTPENLLLLVIHQLCRLVQNAAAARGLCFTLHSIEVRLGIVKSICLPHTAISDRTLSLKQMRREGLATHLKSPLVLLRRCGVLSLNASLARELGKSRTGTAVDELDETGLGFCLREDIDDCSGARGLRREFKCLACSMDTVSAKC